MLTNCSHLSFKSGVLTPVKISVGNKSEQLHAENATAEFYFWGKSPGTVEVDLGDISYKHGFENPSAVTVSESISFKSFLWTVVTLGLYSPVDYEITLLTDSKGSKE